jgi:glycosyltransferase involved in cell wall biosynthesis
VCALVPYPLETTPSQRFRLEQWVPWLAADGIAVTLVPFADRELLQLLYQPGRWLAKTRALSAAFARRLAVLGSAGEYDALVVHRAVSIVGPAVLERLLARRRPLIYDFDDAIFLLHTSAANRLAGWLKFPGKTETICRKSHHVVVGNEYLADYARRFNSHVTVVPTSIDTDVYRPSVARPPLAANGSRVVVGWTGSSTSQTHLELFAPLLHELQARRDVEIRVISDREPDLPGVRFDWRPWNAATEVQEVGRFDIGIMPMPDDAWAPGKCALKALQCMALGVATVASAVGANRDVIEHNANGLLAGDADDWLAQLTGLIDEPERRRRLGDAGRRTVEERYSMRASAASFGHVLRETVRAHAAGQAMSVAG